MDKVRGNSAQLVLLQNYLGFLGLVLLLHGLVTLAFSDFSLALPRLLDRLLRTDPAHAVIHIIWGTILLWQIRLTQQSRLKQQQRLPKLGFIFSVFYLGLGVLGLLVHHPMGLQLDRGENVFHILIGSIALILSLI